MITRRENLLKVSRSRRPEQMARGRRRAHHGLAHAVRRPSRGREGPPRGARVSSNRLEHGVKGAGDLEAFASIFEDEVIETDGKGMERIARRKALIGDDGIPMLFVEGTPLGMMYRMFSGVATPAYLRADAPGALGDLSSVMERNYLKRLEAAAASARDVLVGMDDTSTTAISPATKPAGSSARLSADKAAPGIMSLRSGFRPDRSERCSRKPS